MYSQALADRERLNLTLVDTETTGLDPASDEVIGLGLLCVSVTVATGRVERLVASTVQWREPAAMSAAAEAIVGVTRAALRGRRFDVPEIDRVLLMTDLVVAHNAAFDRPFLERVIPAFVDLPWACSLTDIRWRRVEGLEQASIDFLLSRYGLAPSRGSPQEDCHALAALLEQRLPISPCTGFRKLVDAADAVSVECVLPESVADAVEVLESLGFQRRGPRWRIECSDSTAAERVEAAVIDHAVGNPAFAALRMWREDARSRFAMRWRSIPAR